MKTTSFQALSPASIDADTIFGVSVITLGDTIHDRAVVTGESRGGDPTGTIRGDFGLETAKNLIHASDGEETAAAEIELWFGPNGTIDYPRATDAWILSDEE